MQFKAIVLALFVGLAAASASVIVFFDFGIGPESYAYSWLYNQSAQVPAENDQRETGYEVTHTAYGTKRSSGFFAHPAHAAYYLEYLLPLTLAYLVTARRTRDRLLMITLLAAGSLALYLTFARSGLVGSRFRLCSISRDGGMVPHDFQANPGSVRCSPRNNNGGYCTVLDLIRFLLATRSANALN